MGCILGWLCWHWFLRHKPVTSIIERRIDCKLKKKLGESEEFARIGSV